MKINSLTQRFEICLDILEQFKNQKIKFITKLQESQEFNIQINISQTPVHIDNGCNYFLLDAYWSAQKGKILQNSYRRQNNSNIQSINRRMKGSKNKQNSVSIQQIFFNLIYLLSSTIYLESSLIVQFLNYVNSENKHFYRHQNMLKVMSYFNSDKKRNQIVSTAAQTKFHYDAIQSDIFEQQFLTQRNKTNNSANQTLTPKNYLLEGKKNVWQNTGSMKHHKDKLFSRVSTLQLSKKTSNQLILQQICSINESQLKQFIVVESIKALFLSFQQSQHISTIQEFHEINSKNIIQLNIHKIIENYQNSIELQFSQMDQKPIEDIKHFLKDLFDNSLNHFYDECQNFCNSSTQTLFLNKMLNQIYQVQHRLFDNINKGKKQLLNRKISFYDDHCYIEKSLVQHETKFQSLLGQRSLTDQQIGFKLYRQSIQQKMSQIFSQIIDQKPKKTVSKFRKGKFMTKNEFSTNLQRRIQILNSQKHNLQKTLHYEEILQQNLVQYLKGLQTKKVFKKQIQTISQSSEQVQ